MSFALLIIGITLIVAAVRGTHQLLIQLLKVDFSGPNNFIFWIASLLIVGAVGYVQKLKPLSDGLLVLILLVLVLRKGTGFFDQLTRALASSQSAASGTKSASVVIGGGSATPGIGKSGLTISA